MKWPTVVDLFCGSGGASAGLKNRRFRIVAAVDNDPDVCATYRANHKTVALFENEIQDVSPGEIRAVHLDKKDLDVLVVCSPCQPFSSQNKCAGQDDRAALVLQAVRFAKILKPRVIVVENVPGILRTRFTTLHQRLTKKLSTLGYCVSEPVLLNAANYGVPQRRLRYLLFACLNKLPPPFPEPLTPPGYRVTVADAIADLPQIRSGQADPEDPMHAARDHSSLAIERLKKIRKDGGSRNCLPSDLKLRCHRGHRGHPDVYGRMSWHDVAPTLTTGCTDITKGRFAHPSLNRAITLREAARLQTFPDSYQFVGSKKSITAQIGNAVPVRFFESLAPTLRSALSRIK